MKITAIAPWFGGKRTLAQAIVEELGPHDHYHEPFCGSMSVLFAKPASRQETVNDLHGDLINLARCVQAESTAIDLYDRLSRTLFAQEIFDAAKEVMRDPNAPATPDVDRAAAYFVVSWMGRNGIAGTNIGHLRGASYAMAVRWTNGGGSPTTRFRSAVDSIPAWHERLRNVVILSRDALTYIDRLEDVEGTAIYADPPYVSDTRSGFEGGGGKSHYLHEFSQGGGGIFGQKDDHSRLADILRAYKRARIVVSYYDCPRIRELYSGWTFVDHTMQKKPSRAERPRRAAEGSPRSPDHQRPQLRQINLTRGPVPQRGNVMTAAPTTEAEETTEETQTTEAADHVVDANEMVEPATEAPPEPDHADVPPPAENPLTVDQGIELKRVSGRITQTQSRLNLAEAELEEAKAAVKTLEAELQKEYAEMQSIITGQQQPMLPFGESKTAPATTAPVDPAIQDAEQTAKGHEEKFDAMPLGQACTEIGLKQHVLDKLAGDGMKTGRDLRTWVLNPFHRKIQGIGAVLEQKISEAVSQWFIDEYEAGKIDKGGDEAAPTPNEADMAEVQQEQFEQGLEETAADAQPAVTNRTAAIRGRDHTKALNAVKKEINARMRLGKIKPALELHRDLMHAAVMSVALGETIDGSRLLTLAELELIQGNLDQITPELFASTCAAAIEKQ